MPRQTFEKLYDNNGERVDGYFYDPETDIIYHIRSIAGKLVKFSTEVKRPKIALAKREGSRLLKLKMNGGKKTNVASLIGDEIEPYLKVKMAEDIDSGTYKVVRNAVKKFKPFWEDKFPHEIDADMMAEFYAWFKETYPGEGMDNTLKYFKNFANYLKTKMVNGTPLLLVVPKMKDPDTKDVKARRAKNKENIMEKAHFRRVIEGADFYDPSLEVEERRILASIMYSMCTRINETLSLKFDEQVIMIDGSFFYRWSIGQNKADLKGQHQFPNYLQEKLRWLYKKRKKEGTKLLFPQKRNNQRPMRDQQVKWAKWYEKADLPFKWSSHTFRHSGLSHLFNNEKLPQALILQLYRVSLKTALDTYVKPTKKGLEKMRESIEVPEWN